MTETGAKSRMLVTLFNGAELGPGRMISILMSLDSVLDLGPEGQPLLGRLLRACRLGSLTRGRRRPSNGCGISI